MIVPKETLVVDLFRIQDFLLIDSEVSRIVVDVESLGSAIEIDFLGFLYGRVESEEVDKEVSYFSSSYSRVFYQEIDRSLEWQSLFPSLIINEDTEPINEEEIWYFGNDALVYEDEDVVYGITSLVIPSDVILARDFVFDFKSSSIIVDSTLPKSLDFYLSSNESIIDTHIEQDLVFYNTETSFIDNNAPEIENVDYDSEFIQQIFFQLPTVEYGIIVNNDFSSRVVPSIEEGEGVRFVFYIVDDVKFTYEAEPPKVVTCDDYCNEVSGGNCDLVIEIPVEVGSYNLIMKIGKDIKSMSGLPIDMFWNPRIKAVAGFVTFTSSKDVVIETIDGESIKLRLIPYNSWEKPSLDKILS